MSSLQLNSPRLLALADLDRATLISAQAFRDDPLWCYLIPDRQKRAAALPRFFGTVVSLGIRAQQVYGVGDPLTGVAVSAYCLRRKARGWPHNSSGRFWRKPMRKASASTPKR